MRTLLFTIMAIGSFYSYSQKEDDKYFGDFNYSVKWESYDNNNSITDSIFLLKVTINGIQNINALNDIQINIIDRSQNVYANRQVSVNSNDVIVKGNSATVTFKGLRTGDYLYEIQLLKDKKVKSKTISYDNRIKK